MKQITVIGSSGLIPQEVYKMAEELGESIAEAGAVLITGGRDGVMEAACKGAKKRGGLTVGILPGSKDETNPYTDITIVTGMGDGRNVINVKSADSVISVHGSTGTLSEIALALNAGKRVIAIRSSGGVSKMMAGVSINGREVISTDTSEDAVKLAIEGL
ncbi:MAG: TIGR00725 family protein [Candidatus Bathyarchaeota archaeon]|nr:TIGR00725 family protein [Candidatus Bathyarchaeota archaeon]